MKKILILHVFFFAFAAAAYCGQASKIELTDGSLINGEIVSYANNVYTINTAAFGEIKIEAAKVSKIESANPAQSRVSDYGQTLMKDPENAAIITELASDPQFQEMAKDTQIIDAAKTGDIQALMGNPKFMNIVNSPKVQEALKKIKQ